MPNLFLNHDERFQRKISNFPETLYRINDPTSKIYKLLYSLLEIGVGQAKGMQDVALNSQSSLATTSGAELDQYFQIFGIKRNVEISSNFKDSLAEDSRFRVAISKFVQAISLGGTVEGLRLMAEASTGFTCHVIEPWRNPEAESIESSMRLKDQNSKPIGNEVVIFVYPNRFLGNDERPLVELGEGEEDTTIKDEANALRIRVIENCKLIAPLHTSITVKIQDIVEPLELIPSYVTSNSFSYIDEFDDVDLLSQETEISFNNFVNNINTFEFEEEFTIPVGEIADEIDLEMQQIKVFENVALSTTNVYLKLSDGENEEIVFVKSRKFFENFNIFLYEVERAQSGTEALEFSAGATVFSNIVPIYSESQQAQETFDNWLPIPIADSPDNFASGKFFSDATRYDVNGNYLFEWGSQAEFLTWFTNYINNIGGEVKNNQYRLSTSEQTSSNSNTNLNIINQVMGPAYGFVRPIPKTMD